MRELAKNKIKKVRSSEKGQANRQVSKRQWPEKGLGEKVDKRGVVNGHGSAVGDHHRERDTQGLAHSQSTTFKKSTILFYSRHRGKKFGKARGTKRGV